MCERSPGAVVSSPWRCLNCYPPLVSDSSRLHVLDCQSVELSDLFPLEFSRPSGTSSRFSGRNGQASPQLRPSHSRGDSRASPPPPGRGRHRPTERDAGGGCSLHSAVLLQKKGGRARGVAPALALRPASFAANETSHGPAAKVPSGCCWPCQETRSGAAEPWPAGASEKQPAPSPE